MNQLWTVFRPRGLFLLAALLLMLGVAHLPATEAQTPNLPAGFTQYPVASGLNKPTTMTFAPDGRLFVAQQGGALRVIENGVLLGTPFVTLSVNSQGERGLLGIAFDPDFSTNNFVYVYYTVSGSPIHNRVSRFTANGNVAVNGSEAILLDLNNLSATNHNGGSLHFGLDGKLYVAVGENANGSNAQSMNNLLGKILRINSDGSIPTDNPFYNTASGQNRAIWALGLRNPFMFSFQPGSGRMFINDVGQSAWEEIDDGIAGSNYGWPTTEGVTSNPAFRSPLYAYNHTNACAITGGAFYNPTISLFPNEYMGDYFFADYCGNWIQSYDVATDTAHSFATNTPVHVVDLDVDEGGSLYFLAQQSGGTDGAVYRIGYTCEPPATSPANAAPLRNRYETDSPTLTWNTVNGATHYEVQVDNTPNFLYPDYRNDQIPASQLSVTTNSLVNCLYYWRVRGQLASGAWGAWSKTESFTVAAP